MESKITNRILTESKLDFDDDYNYYLKKIDDIINNSNKKTGILEILKKEIQMLITQNLADAELFPDKSSVYKYGVVKYKDLQDIINLELEKLSKFQSKPKSPKILAFNNDVEGSLDDMEIILKDINKLLFDSSTSQQWEQLFGGEKLDNPIVISNGVTIKDIKYFIKSLRNKTLKGRIYEDLGRLNVFIFEGEILTGKQMQKVDESTDAKLKNQIDNIISKLK